MAHMGISKIKVTFLGSFTRIRIIAYWGLSGVCLNLEVSIS